MVTRKELECSLDVVRGPARTVLSSPSEALATTTGRGKGTR